MRSLIILPLLLMLAELTRRARLHRRGTEHRTDAGLRFWMRGPAGATDLPVRTVVAVPAPNGLSLDLRLETWWDRIVRGLRLCRETQTGDEGFDRRVFVESDDLRLHRWLHRSAEARAELQDLLDGEAGLRVRRIGCRNGTLYAEAARRTSRMPSVAVEGLAQRLAGLAGQLFPIAAQLAIAEDCHAARARRLQLMAAALVVMGTVGAVLTFFLSYRVLDLGALSLAALAIGALLWLGVGMLVPITLWRSAHSPAVLRDWLVFGLWGCLLCGFGLLYHGNRWLDTGAGVRRSFPEADYSVKRSNIKGGVAWRYQMRDWRPGREGEFLIVRRVLRTYGTVPRDAREAILELRVRPGGLGFAWIESVAERPVTNTVGTANAQ